MSSYLGTEFVKVGFAGRGQIGLSVFVKRRDAQHIQERATNTKALDKVSFGFKGGVTVSFTLYDMSFSFVNCHLKSGAFKAPGRL